MASHGGIKIDAGVRQKVVSYRFANTSYTRKNKPYSKRMSTSVYN